MYEDDIFLEKLKGSLNLQLEGLEACKNKGEILCLIGCMNLIEFTGGIINGKLGKAGFERSRFKEGIRFLGGIYADSAVLGEDRMWKLRCAVTHQYIPENSDVEVLGIDSVISIKHPEIRPRDIIRTMEDPKNFAKVIKLNELVIALKEVSSRLLKILKTDNNMRATANIGFSKLPIINRVPGFREGRFEIDKTTGLL